MTVKTPLLSINELSVTYGAGPGAVKAVRNLSCDIGCAEVVGLVGESGSGKSTVAQAILGLLDSDNSAISGSIEFSADNVLAYDSAQWRAVRGSRIGMLFQSPESSFNPVTTIGEQMLESLCWHKALSKAQAKTAAIKALSDVGMPRPDEVFHHYAFELSGGMCQRAALALAMSLQPSLLLADEPTASLDVVAQAELVRWMGRVQKQRQLAMLVISHDLNLIARLADRILVMYQGEILEQGPTRSVLENPQHDYTRALINAVPRLTKYPSISAGESLYQANTEEVQS